MRETLGNKSTRLCITVVGSSSVGKTGELINNKVLYPSTVVY